MKYTTMKCKRCGWQILEDDYKDMRFLMSCPRCMENGVPKCDCGMVDFEKVQHHSTNSHRPRSKLGDRLLSIRQNAIREGEQLLPVAEIVAGRQ